jgi:hypothetical protein
VVSKKPVKIAMDDKVITAHLLKGGVQVPTSWCEAIPDITPEPGDICEFWDDVRPRVYLLRFVEKKKGLYIGKGVDTIASSWENCRVLARKPLGAIAAHDAISGFFNALLDNDTQSVEAEAYNAFLQVILGTVYGRVDK